MKAAIVIVSWNKYALLFDAVTSALKHSGVGIGVVVVDNGSTDVKTREYLMELEKVEYVKVIYLDENMGCPAALNAGFNWAFREGADFIFRCDNDIQFSDGAIEEVISVCKRTGGLVSPITNSGGEWQSKPEQSRNTYAKGGAIKVPTLTGFCTCYPAKAWKEIGEFPDKLKDGTRVLAYGEDTAHCLMARAKGFDCYIAPAAWVFHEHGASRDLGDFEANRKIGPRILAEVEAGLK